MNHTHSHSKLLNEIILDFDGIYKNIGHTGNYKELEKNIIRKIEDKGNIHKLPEGLLFIPTKLKNNLISIRVEYDLLKYKFKNQEKYLNICGHQNYLQAIIFLICIDVIDCPIIFQNNEENLQGGYKNVLYLNKLNNYSPSKEIVSFHLTNLMKYNCVSHSRKSTSSCINLSCFLENNTQHVHNNKFKFSKLLNIILQIENLNDEYTKITVSNFLQEGNWNAIGTLTFNISIRKKTVGIINSYSKIKKILGSNNIKYKLQGCCPKIVNFDKNNDFNINKCFTNYFILKHDLLWSSDDFGWYKKIFNKTNYIFIGNESNNKLKEFHNPKSEFNINDTIIFIKAINNYIKTRRKNEI